MNKTAKIILGVVVLVIIVVLVVVFYKPIPKETIKIGVSIPLTGEAASYGDAAIGGLKLAQKEINENGGILKRQVELIFEDDQCAARAGIDAWNKLLNIDKPVAVLGPICSSVASSVLPMTKTVKIPVLIDAATAPGLTLNSDYVFAGYPTDSTQGKFAADYIFDKLDKKRAAILYVKNAWGEGIKGIFSEQFIQRGGRNCL
jgi:branched-chain amino acid transport system substrate-binding protein